MMPRSARCNMAEFFVDPKERARLVSELHSYGRVRHFEYQLRARSGRVIIVIENSRVVTAGDGRALYFEGTITDITQRKAAERALFNEKERAQVTLQSIGDAVVTTDARGNIEYLNPVAEQLTGWEAREAQGMPIETIITLTRRDDRRGRRESRIALPAGRARRDAGGQRRARGARRLDDRDPGLGRADPRSQRSSRRRGDGVPRRAPGAAAASQARLSRESRPADGFINRRELEERLSTALAAIKAETGKTAALLYMDLDQFKVVNDTCGHSAGDLLLRQLGDVLRARVPKTGALARLGGDEFAVLLPDCTIYVAAARDRGVAARGDRGIPLLVARQRAAGRCQHRHRAGRGRQRERGDR